MSEQPIEALHHQVNKDQIRFAAMRNREVIIKKCIEQSCLRNALFDQELSQSFNAAEDFEQDLPNTIQDHVTINV